MKKATKVAIAVSAFACAAILSLDWSKQDGVLMSVGSAQARVGRPLTPVSVAGVARRHTRRAVYGAGIAGAAVVGTAAAVAAAPSYGGGYYTGGPYYGGTGYYSTGPYYQGTGGPYAAYRYPAQHYNGTICQPGSMVTLDDGKQYPCQ